MKPTHIIPQPMRAAMRPALQCMGLMKPLSIFDEVMARRFQGKACSVMQVGANDGKLADPLYPWFVLARPWTRHWTGLLIEPIPYIFERLKANYAGRPGLQFLNAAIGESSGTLKLWTLRREARQDLNLNPHTEQLSSFDRGHIPKLLGPRVEPYMIDIDVPCLSLSEVMTTTGVQHVDVLHVDAEGYDWRILKQIDFTNVAPSVVLYEQKHMPPDDRVLCRQMFESNGYSVTEDGEDSVAER